MIHDFAVYRLTDGYIENIIRVDLDEHKYTPSEGFSIVEIPNDNKLFGQWSMCGIGWSYINSQFVEPPEPLPESV